MHVHTRAQANPNTFAHTQTDGHGASSCLNYFYFQLSTFSLVFPEFRIINVAFSPENNKTLFLASDMYHACVQCNEWMHWCKGCFQSITLQNCRFFSYILYRSQFSILMV